MIRVPRKYYWAVVSRNGVVIEDTIRRTRRAAIEHFVLTRHSDFTWRWWRRQGVTVIRVRVVPIERGEAIL